MPSATIPPIVGTVAMAIRYRQGRETATKKL